MKYVINLNEINLSDLDIVGGKNASTGEMIQHLAPLGIKIPSGFATTVEAYKEFLSKNNINNKIDALLNNLKTSNIKLLNKTSLQIRRLILKSSFLPEMEKEIALAYADLKNTTVAVRSSATAEDLPTASFAGQQETFLNIKGLKNVLEAIKLVYASLFTSRAIAYRHHHKLDHQKFGLSVGIQMMIRSDKGASGVMFTIDTESGFDKVIMISASYGLGETIVQGRVNPDEFLIYKPALEANKFSILQRRLGEKAIKMIYTKTQKPAASLKTVSVSTSDRSRFCIDDKDIQILSHQALLIEKHYQKPMDIEWAKDGETGQIVILQARPETVKSQNQQDYMIERYILSLTKNKNKIITQGQSIGQRIGNGVARIILNPKKIRALSPGEILVTDMTDPDWEPLMKSAAAIVTNRGGRTCHAAIVARELGIPAVIGCNDATTHIKEGEAITVSCAEGQTGYVYAGKLSYIVNKVSIKDIPKLPVKLCINLGNPDKAFTHQFLPNDGVGLARLEFIIGNMIGIHPNAALQFKKLPIKLKQQILKKSTGYKNPVEFYIEKLREGISTIAAAFYPKEVIFRFSDFKSNEYANLIGGNLFEPEEENPMLGFRGASRYIDARFRECFELECKAFKRVRDNMGLNNAQLMVPFVRTVDEIQKIIQLIEANGLKSGENNLKIYMMCEIPSNIILAKEFLKYVDGFSIGSNDLTQLTLGLDRDSSLVASLFDERNEAIKILLHQVINECNKANKYIGICGQAPSDHPDFAQWLMREGIQSMSLNADTVVETWLLLARTLKSNSV